MSGDNPLGATGRLFTWIATHRTLSFVVLLLLLLEMWHAASTVRSTSRHHPTWNWIVLGFLAYGALTELVALPWLVRRARTPQAAEIYVAMALAFATAPFLVAFCGYLSGADTWVMPVGFFTSGTLSATALRRTERTVADYKHR